MLFSWWRLVQRRTPKAAKRPGRFAQRSKFFRNLELEVLESRLAPAVITHEWTGLGGDNLWSDSLNWTNGSPAADAGVGNTPALVFHTNNPKLNTVDDIANLNVDSINFDANSGPNSAGGTTSTGYTIGGTATINFVTAGNGINLAAGEAASAGVVIAHFASGITFNLNAGPSIVFTNSDANATLTADGTISSTSLALARNLTVSTAGGTSNNSALENVILNGPINNGPNLGFPVLSLTKNGNGTLTLGGTGSTYSGGTTVNNGAVNVLTSTALGATTASTTLNGQSANTAGQIVLHNGITVTQANFFVNSNANGGAIQALNSTDTVIGNVVLGTSGGGIFNTALGASGASAILRVNGPISGGTTGSTILHINGPGTVEFLRDNSYLGPTALNAAGPFSIGVLQVDAPNGLGAGGAGNETTVGNGGTLRLNGSFTLQDASSAPENLNLQGSGVGGEGALHTLGGGTYVVPGTVRLNSDSTVNVDGPGKLTLSGQVTGGGGLTKNGDGRLILDNAANTNNYTGLTTINGGVVEARQTKDLGDLGAGDSAANGTVVHTGTALQFNIPAGGTVNELLQLQGGAFFPGTSGNLEDVAGTILLQDFAAVGNVPMITLTGSDATISVDQGADTFTVNGLITGGAGIIKEGPGTLQLEGVTTNNYTGTTTVNAGTLLLNKTEPPVPNSPLLAVPGALIIGQPATTVVPPNATVRLLGRDELAIAPLTINPTGLLDLNGFHQTAGPVTMNAGEIDLNGGTLQLSADVTATSVGIGASTFEAQITNGGGGRVDLGGATRTFTINPGPFLAENSVPEDMEIDVPITGNGGLIKAGTGGIEIDANSTFTGTTTINAGLLRLGSATGLSTGAITVNSGGTLALENDNTPGTGGGGITVANAINLNGTGSAGQGALVNENSNNTTTGPVVLQSDSTIGVSAAGDTLEMRGVISGAGALTKVGPGRLFFNTVGAPTADQSNTYAGGTTVTDGTLELNRFHFNGVTFASDVAIPNVGNTLVIGDGIGGLNSDVVLEDLSGEIASGKPVTINRDGELNVQGSAQTIGALNMTGGHVAGAGGDVTLTGPVTATSAAVGEPAQIDVSNLTLDPATTFTVNHGPNGVPGVSPDLDIQSTIGGPGDLIEDSTSTPVGVLELTNGSPNTYGNTTVNHGELDLDGASPSVPRNLTVNNASVVRTLADNQFTPAAIFSLTFNGGSLLDLFGTDQTVPTLNLNSSTVNVGPSPLAPLVFPTLTLTDGVNSSGFSAFNGPGRIALPNTQPFDVAAGGTLNVNPIVADVFPFPGTAGGVTKDGPGTMVLSNNNTYTGPTKINDGVLDVNGSQPQSPVNVDPGTLGGTGTVGPITESAPGHPGANVDPAGPGSVGTLTSIGNDALNDTFSVDLGGTTSTDYDRLNDTGHVSIGAGSTLVINTSNLNAPAGTTFTIIQASTGVSGTFTNVTVIGGPQNLFTVQYNPNSVVLVLNAQVVSPSVLINGSNPATTFFGQPALLTATFPAVSPAVTGTVTFFANGVFLGTAPIDLPTRTASLSVSTLQASPTPYLIEAKYSGDSHYAASEGTATLTVNKATTATSLSVTPNSGVTAGQTAQLLATVTDSTAGSTGTPGGLVTFLDGATVIGVAGLSSGQASIITGPLSGGTHNFHAAYGGDSNFQTSTGSASLFVAQHSSSTSVQVSGTPTVGQPLTFTATVTGAPSPLGPTGQVQFQVDGVNAGSPVNLANGQATFTTSSLSVGPHTITANYLGDTNNLPSSGSANVTIAKVTTSTTLTVTPNNVTQGDAVTLSASVSGGSGGLAPTGTVTFKDTTTGQTLASNVALSGGTAAVVISSAGLSAGPHSIVAVYSGDTNNASSTSPAVTLSVAQPVPERIPGPGTPSGTNITNLFQIITAKPRFRPRHNDFVVAITLHNTSGKVIDGARLFFLGAPKSVKIKNPTGFAQNVPGVPNGTPFVAFATPINGAPTVFMHVSAPNAQAAQAFGLQILAGLS